MSVPSVVNQPVITKNINNKKMVKMVTMKIQKAISHHIQ